MPRLPLQYLGLHQNLLWMRRDGLVRLVPFSALALAVEVIWHPRWMGFSLGRLDAQLWFGFTGAVVLFVGSAGVQRLLSQARGGMTVPSGPGSASVEGGYYLLNGPIEEAVFRGFVQGGLGMVVPIPIAMTIATAIYVLYHRLGPWPWPDVAATALVGVPLALAFWLLPGPPSLLGVSIAHIGATCGFLGPGTYLMRRLNLV
ncbi:MAG TPA: CPBP family intramembrane glutamic endopeptidase [Candidatus Dormibacteraeota bacterium]|nr:CPBP family intramembrane glutamic endopeptidase [Candidatus Dormibacteraeota bacterium]